MNLSSATALYNWMRTNRVLRAKVGGVELTVSYWPEELEAGEVDYTRPEKAIKVVNPVEPVTATKEVDPYEDPDTYPDGNVPRLPDFIHPHEDDGP